MKNLIFMNAKLHNNVNIDGDVTTKGFEKSVHVQSYIFDMQTNTAGL